MVEISSRVPRNVSGKVNAWERILNGVRYWFDATPYEVKVFRLRLDGGDLVHHWRDAPDTVGEYNPFDPSTRPLPGQIAWSGPRDRTYFTSCRVCEDVVKVTREQLIAYHGGRYGTSTCVGGGTAATLKAALVRDAQQTPEEDAMGGRVSRWLGSCTGFDTMYGERCHHPGCQDRTSALVLELRSLRILRDPSSDLARYFSS